MQHVITKNRINTTKVLHSDWDGFKIAEYGYGQRVFLALISKEYRIYSFTLFRMACW
jgi:hypothetical protein